MKKTRAAAWLIAAAFVLIMASSFVFLAEHAGHRHHHPGEGDRCPVCEVIAQCGQHLKLTAAVLVTAGLSALLFRACLSAPAAGTGTFFSETLVSWKVKLTD